MGGVCVCFCVLDCFCCGIFHFRFWVGCFYCIVFCYLIVLVFIYLIVLVFIYFLVLGRQYLQCSIFVFCVKRDLCDKPFTYYDEGIYLQLGAYVRGTHSTPILTRSRLPRLLTQLPLYTSTTNKSAKALTPLSVCRNDSSVGWFCSLLLRFGENNCLVTRTSEVTVAN